MEIMIWQTIGQKNWSGAGVKHAEEPNKPCPIGRRNIYDGIFGRHNIFINSNKRIGKPECFTFVGENPIF